MIGPPAVDVDRERITFTWDDAPEPFRILFLGLRETARTIKGEIRVETAHPVQDGKHGLWHWGAFDLTAHAPREQLVKKLASRNDRNNWALYLETACERAAFFFRQGEPTIDLSTVPEPGDVSYLVNPFLIDGETNLLSADGESGKSWLAVAIAIAVASGTPIPGFKPLKQGPVLYVDYETGLHEVRRRISWVCRGANLLRIPRIHYRGMMRSLTEDIDALRREVESVEAVLVIVDSLGPATAEDLNESGAAIRVMNALRTLGPATRLVLAHVPKATADQAGGRGRTLGSVFFENLARSVWEARREEHPTNPTIGLYHRKVNQGRHHDPFALELAFDDENRMVRFRSAEVTDSPQLAQYASLAVRVRAALRRGGQTTTELAQALDVNERSLRVTLGRMPDIVQIQEGKPGRGGSPATWGLKASGG